jgi:hypothetical protein
MTPLETRLASLAASGETITYGALARELGLRMGELTTALEALMEQDATAGHPFRAALCAGRLNDGLPATGFFLKAAELGRYDGGDRGAYVTAERAALRR